MPAVIAVKQQATAAYALADFIFFSHQTCVLQFARQGIGEAVPLGTVNFVLGVPPALMMELVRTAFPVPLQSS